MLVFRTYCTVSRTSASMLIDVALVDIPVQLLELITEALGSRNKFYVRVAAIARGLEHDTVHRGITHARPAQTTMANGIVPLA